MLNKLVVSIISLGLVTALSSGCAGARSGQEQPAGEQRISSMEGYSSRFNPAHLSSGEARELADADPDALVLDVRSEESYAQRHVSGAVNVPFGSVEEFARTVITEKDRLIICYCFCDDKGGAALAAVEILAGLGFTNAFYMEPESEWEYAGVPAEEAADKKSGHVIVSGSEAKEIYDSDPGAILLDVRNQDEYDAGHIEGSVLIPVSELENRLSELPDKEAVIIVYCRSGGRSASAYETLAANGYSNVYDMQSFGNWPGGTNNK